MPGSSGVHPVHWAEGEWSRQLFSLVPKGWLPSLLGLWLQMQSTGRAEAKVTGFNRMKALDMKGSLKVMKSEVDEERKH